MTDKPNLADVRRVTEAATGGPWAVPGFGDPLLGPSDVCTEGEPGYRHIICEGAGHDAEFIAASRTLVPALLAAVDAVLALHQPCNVGGKQLCEYCTATGDPFCTPDGTDEWPCPTVRAITAHLDIEEQR